MADALSKIDALEPARQPDELGRLGPYRVLRKIGTGGMGRVYLAEDARLKRAVALKVMNEKFAATPNSRRRFLEEARAMAAVDQDNVVRIYEVGEHAGTPFMAMELLKGGSLEPINASDQRFSWEQIITLARQVCFGLAAAYQRGIIHRDIKPGNIWIEANTQRAKILDFGLALAEGPMGQLAGRGSVVGTPGYLSPEQARNEPLDDRSDLYSLGVVLFELCTGKLPFQAKTIPQMLVAIISHPAPKVRELNPDVPQPLAELIDRLLAKEARERPASALALEAELVQVAEAIDSESHAALQIVTEPKAVAAKPAKDAKVSGQMSSENEPKKIDPKVFWGVSALSALSLVVIGILVLPLFRDTPKPSAAAPLALPKASRPEKPITPQTLKPLVLQNLTAVRSQVGSGDFAILKFDLVNQAAAYKEDPTRIHAGAKVVAECHLYLQSADGVRRENYALPLRRGAKQLPSPGKSSALEFRFNTASVPLGDYTAVVTLETPKHQKVSELTTPLRITTNFGSGELVGFKTVRTWAGIGADTSVGEKAAKDAGDAKQLTLAGTSDQPPAKQQHLYLRFDLTRWEAPREKLEHAVLMLTLTGDAPKSPFEIRAYAAGEALSSDWQESGENALQASDVPAAGDLGKLRFLGTIEADNSGDVLKNKTDAVRLYGPELDDAIQQAGDAITIILVRSKGASKPLRFYSKESEPEKAPGLALRARP